MKLRTAVAVSAASLVAAGLVPAFATSDPRQSTQDGPLDAKATAAGVVAIARDAPDAARPLPDVSPPARERPSPEAPEPAVRRHRRTEQLRLGCHAVAREDRIGVACHWSSSEHPRFAGYVLRRGDGQQRQTVFRSDDETHTRFVDRAVRPGARYTYVLQVLDRGGNVIGAGGPVTVRTPPSDAVPARPQRGALERERAGDERQAR